MARARRRRNRNATNENEADGGYPDAPHPEGANLEWGVPEEGAFPFNAAWWRNMRRSSNGEFARGTGGNGAPVHRE